MPLNINTNAAASSASYYLSNNAALQRASPAYQVVAGSLSQRMSRLAVSMKLSGIINRLTEWKKISIMQFSSGTGWCSRICWKNLRQNGRVKALSQDVLKNSSDI